MTIDEVQNEIIEEFSVFDDNMDKYSYIVELGNGMEGIDPKYKVDQNVIKGCQSKVWIHPEFKDGKIYFEGESDAIIVKGLVALMLRIMNGRTPKEILDADLHFIDVIGLNQLLSPTRSNGFLAMMKQVKLYALAYDRIAQK